MILNFFFGLVTTSYFDIRHNITVFRILGDIVSPRILGDIVSPRTVPRLLCEVLIDSSQITPPSKCFYPVSVPSVVRCHFVSPYSG